MSRRGLIALGAVALAVGAGVYAWSHLPRDGATRAPVSKAVLRFRKIVRQGGGRAAGVRSGPELGVYRYATRGGEDLNAVILATRHDYRGVSTITIAPAPCGTSERWVALVERWTVVEVCREAAGIRIKSVRDFHEFFGVARSVPFECEGRTRPVASELRVGMRWRTDCSSESGSVSTANRVTGIEAVRVAGRSFPAVHTRSSIVLEGDNSGTGRQDEWRRRSDGLLLRKSARAEADFSTAGGGHLSESYSLRLISPDPQR